VSCYTTPSYFLTAKHRLARREAKFKQDEMISGLTRDQQGYGKPWGFSKGFVEGRGRG